MHHPGEPVSFFSIYSFPDPREAVFEKRCVTIRPVCLFRVFENATGRDLVYLTCLI
jgi:hypothetical protein